MTELREPAVVFNVVWTGTVFTYLRYFVASQIAHSQARFRFVANGCPPEQVDLMERFRAQHPDRVVEVVDVSPEVMVAHGVALDRVRATRDDGELFCTIDPDIKANGPFLAPFLQLLDDHDAVTSGKEVWSDDNVVPPNHPGVAGEFFFDRRGFTFGSPHLALYRREALEDTTRRWGVGLGSAGPDLSDDAQQALARLGHSYLVYDTAKIVNALLQADGRSLVHRDLPQLVHIGGLSHYLSPSEYRTNERGEREPDWTKYETMTARHEVTRYTARTLRALADGSPPPPVPAGLEASMERRLALVRDEVTDLMEHHGPGRAPEPSGGGTDRSDPLTGARRRYLALLKDALLDRHYLDNEVRLQYVLGLPAGVSPEPEKLRDPARTLEVRFKRLAHARATGRSIEQPRGHLLTPFTDMGRPALDHLEAVLLDVVGRGVEGDVVECGVGRGGGAILLRGALEAHDIADRTVWLVDRFRAGAPAGADLNQVRDGFERFDLLDERVRFLQGQYEATLADAPLSPIALLRIGADAAEDLTTALDHLVPRVAAGGVVVVEGVGRPQVERRLVGWRRAAGIAGRLDRVDWNTVVWRVDEVPRPPRPAAPGADATPPVPHRIPLAPAVETERLALSVVVVFYDMAREAVRTLQSLSRSYQQGIDDVAYEVIAVDNGSHPEQALREEDVAAFGPEFRLIRIDEAPPSPTVALNRGIAASRGDSVALMIDGAHVLTPGVFRHALAALRTYAPAVVAIQQWYVGPGQQGDASQAGYDHEVEDRLFRRIRWPTDGYRLFDIGHFIGDRDWFDGIVESNCLFAPRAVLEQVGGFDDSFDMPGGGYANLELFERLHSQPGVTPASVLGEGTFHQFHGGTTTNVADEAVRRQRVFSYGEHFRALRGRGLEGLNKPVHYVGAMDTKAARRTRSRREFLLAFDADRDPVTSTPTTPLPVPDELKLAAIEAMWHQQAWREATWLGHPVCRYPTDLHSYQELISRVRPEVVVIVGDDVGLGGRALYAASVLDQLGRGRVVAVGQPPDGARPPHPRVHHVVAPGSSREAATAVGAEVGGTGAMVLLGLGAPDRVIAAFEAYAPLVPVGGYVVVENTVVNGRPAASGFGPGPHEAVATLLQVHRDFVPDVALERYTVTFNKNGYLRRTGAP